jgi:hypothetical protein
MAPANPCSSGGQAAGADNKGFEMTMTSTFAQRVFAAFAAVGMTTFMLVAYFHVPAAYAVQGIVA